jgi:cyclophilin family peptidyl-prolyl cis-trans isomerase
MNRCILLGILALSLLGCDSTPEQSNQSDPAKTNETQQPDPAQKPPEMTPPTPVDQNDPLAVLADFGSRVDKSVATWRYRLPQPPSVTFPAGRSYFWNLTTSAGDIRIRLMPDVAPMHVASTIYLTQLGYYDGLHFHRVITGFMAQGGCPFSEDPKNERAGTGGPGYKYAGEFSPAVKHTKGGLLSMANAGPGTDGSQFFITFKPTSWLDGKHTIFGEVVDGMEAVRAIEQLGSASGKPSQPIRLISARITAE